MSAAPHQPAPARLRLAARTRPIGRQQAAFVAGECALDGTGHGVTLLLYYKYLVALAGNEQSSLFTQTHVAVDNGVSTRTIRRYDNILVGAGLIRLTTQGRLIRRAIVAYDDAPEPPDPVPPDPPIVEHSPSFFGDECGQIDPVNADRSIRVPPINVRSRDDQGEQASAGGAVPPIEPGNAETIDLLTDLGVYPETARRLGYVAPEVVRETIDQADRCGRARDLAAFVAFALEHGGVYGARATPRASPARHGPRRAAPSPGGGYSICGCGRVVPAEWEGHCPACYPEMFDPPPGGAP